MHRSRRHIGKKNRKQAFSKAALRTPESAQRRQQARCNTAGANLPSNVNRLPLVPTTALTVTTTCDRLLSVVGTPEWHCTAVPDDHDAVLHSSDPDTSPADGVNPNAPKLSPVIVTELDPLVAPFGGCVELATGAAHRPISKHQHSTALPPPPSTSAIAPIDAAHPHACPSPSHTPQSRHHTQQPTRPLHPPTISTQSIPLKIPYHRT